MQIIWVLPVWAAVYLLLPFYGLGYIWAVLTITRGCVIDRFLWRCISSLFSCSPLYPCLYILASLQDLEQYRNLLELPTTYGVSINVSI